MTSVKTVFFGTRASLGPSTKDFTPGTYVEVQQATIRNRWDTVHTIRTASSVAGLGCLAAAALVSSADRVPESR